MAKYRGPVCRLCRREGEKLFLKGTRCFTPNALLSAVVTPPASMGKAPSSARSVNRTLPASCAPSRKRAAFTGFMKPSSIAITGFLKRRGLTGLNLLQILESRLDNVIYPPGLASNRAEARLLVTHGHFAVNGRRTDVPSMLLSAGDELLFAKARKREYFKELADLAEDRNVPVWLSRDVKGLEGTSCACPNVLKSTAT
jgi:small subunit ribosomal protein S4